jgi:short-subunit dehydrogenase
MQPNATSPWPWRTILITGASSGIGRALAEALAAPGVTLHLGGRDAARLAEAAAACTTLGATVATRQADVRDAAAMADWIGGAGKLELVIANAGIGAGTGQGFERAEEARAVFETNITGVLNTVIPAVATMAAQPADASGLRGRIAVVASIASFVATPGAPAYAAAKAAVQRWAEALDATERRRGIRLHSICPGYIRTPLTARNRFPMPLLMEPAEAAQRSLAGLRAGHTRIAFPRRMYALARLVGALPPGWRAALMAGFPGKD